MRIVRTDLFRRFVFSIAIALAATAAIGCMPDVEKETGGPTERVQPVFDSEAATIPLPNDAALDEQGTLPDLDGIEGDDATGEFLSWLTTLHGWLPSTTIEVPFDGKLQKKTVSAKHVKLYRIRGDGKLESREIADVRYEETKVTVAAEKEGTKEIEGSRIIVEPKEDLETHREYAVVVTKGIKGANGNAIVEPQPIFFAASNEPLVDENGEKTIESLPDDKTAQQLEALRQSLAPVFEGASMDRTEIAMAFRWSTLKDPQTILDPASATLPTPNDAAIEGKEGHPPEQVGTFPASALDGVEVKGEDTDGDGEPDEFRHVTTKDTAQAHFNAYIDRLHGWPPPPQTPIELPIAGEVKPDSVGPGSVHVWRYTLESDGKGGQTAKLQEKIEAKEIAYDDKAGTVTVTPKNPLPKRKRYLAFATDDIENADGLSLKLPAALQMAIQPHPVLKDGSSTVPQLSDGQAKSIQGLRSFLRPAVEGIQEKTDYTRGDLGAIWTWQNWTDTFAVFDPTNGVLPFPHALQRKDDGSIDLSTMGLMGIQKSIVEELNRRNGFSTTAPGWIPLDGPIDSSTVDKNNIRFVWSSSTTTEGYDKSRYRLDYREKWNRIVVHPTSPWNRDTRTEAASPEDALNVGAVLKGLKDPQGRPVMPSPTFVFLRSPYPLWKKGEGSTVDQLSDDQAKQLEAERADFNALLQLAEAGQVDNFMIEDRNQVSLGYGAHPENPVQALQEFRAQALEKVSERSSSSVARACEPNCSPDPNKTTNPGSSYQGPDGSGTAVDMSNVQTIQWAAEFDTVTFLKSDGSMADYSGATDETVGASIFVPKGGPNCSRPFRVVLAQHDLESHRIRAGMALANALAGECLATVVMDFPGHGGRAPNASSLHPSQNPSKSGEDFISADVRATKNRLLQSAVDVTVLAQIVQDDALEAAMDANTSNDLFDYGSDNEIGYIGGGLGGLIGFPAATVDSNLTVGVYNATGGGWADIWAGGEMGDAILQKLDQAGLMEGSFERFRVMAYLQWLAGPIDPLAFAPFNSKNPVAERTYESGMNGGFSTGMTLAADESLLQMAKNPSGGDDKVVPNATTERLAQSAGLSVSESTYDAPHAFLFELDSGAQNYDATDCARRQAAAWLSSGLGGMASYPNNLKASNCQN